VRFEQTCFRAHDPRWAFKPLSGDGAAIRGARFNPKGMPAIYLGLDIMTAVKEANQGFAHKIDPCILCSYEVACDDIADLRTVESRAEHSVPMEDLACAGSLCWRPAKSRRRGKLSAGYTEMARLAFLSRALPLAPPRRTITLFCGGG